VACCMLAAVGQGVVAGPSGVVQAGRSGLHATRGVTDSRLWLPRWLLISAAVLWLEIGAGLWDVVWRRRYAYARGWGFRVGGRG